MDNGVDLVVGEDFLHRFSVAHIRLIKRNGSTGDLLYPFDRFGTGIGIVVGDHNGVSCLDQLDAGVRADISGAAC